MATTYDFNDKAGLLYVITTIRDKTKGYLEEYVKKEIGKGLSSNDFTNEMKAKLDGIAAEATKVIVDTIITSSGTNPVQGQAIYSALEKKANATSPEFAGTPTTPTALPGTNSLQIANTAFVQNAINTALSGITGIDLQVVTELPETGKKGTFYFVNREGASESNAYDEYVWVNDKWEFIGSTTIDLSSYVKAEQIVPITTAEIDAMFAEW